MSIAARGLSKFLSALSLILMVMCGSAAAADDAEVRVGLKYGGITTAALTGDNVLGFYDSVTGETLYASEPGESVLVSVNGVGLSSYEKFFTGNAEIAVYSEGPISYEGQRYRGYFRLRNKDGVMQVINVVHIDDYLAAVLGKEMSASFPQEALKAQAICAKNFVYGGGGKSHGGDFDVCASTHCQVYGGISGESEATRRAVEAVSGKAAYYDGKIVALNFFATSGGATENSEYVWGSPVPYLKSVSDPYEPTDKASHYTWTAHLSAEEIKSKLAAAGVNIGDITGVKIEETTPAGRALTLTFTGTNGAHTVRRSACRTILGFYSQWFTVEPDAKALAAGGEVEGNVALTGDGNAQIGGGRVLTGSGVQSISASGGYTFNGRGYGHGVGMSQWGAYGMAEQGYDYKEIIEHYFTGITVK